MDLVAVGVLLLEHSEIVGLGALILSGGEAEVAGTLGLADQSLQRFHVAAFFGYTDELEGILGLRDHILSVVGNSLEERTVGILRHFVQAL